MKKLLTLTLALAALTTIVSCGGDDPSPLALEMVAGDFTHDLSDAYIYLNSESDRDMVDDQSSAYTHHFLEFVITDGNWSTECSPETYYMEVEIYYPIDGDASGTYSTVVDEWKMNTRSVYAEAYYDLAEGSTECNWPSPYKWWGTDGETADVPVSINESDGSITISMKKKSCEDWIYNSGWTQGENVDVSFKFSGDIVYNNN
jgi:hypothetical protein